MKQPPIISFTAVNLIQRANLITIISYVLRKNSFCHFSVSTEELLGDHNFNTEDSKTVKVELEKYFDSTKKRNLKLLLLLLVHNKKKDFY